MHVNYENHGYLFSGSRFLTLIFCVIVFFIIPSCKTNNYKEEARAYSKSDINGFYERCFNADSNIFLNRWKEDIIIYIHGKKTKEDKKTLFKIISQFKELELPIKISISKDSNIANLLIKSDSGKVIKGLDNGCAILKQTNGVIKEGTIYILENLAGRKREEVIKHEMLHALGFATHVASDYRSIFFIVGDSTKEIENTDLNSLKILYNIQWPNDYSNYQFEKSFADLLYHKNSIQQVIKLTKVLNIDTIQLKEILEYGMLQLNGTKEEAIYKFPNHTNVFYKGKVPFELKDSIIIILDEFNSVSPHIQFEYSEINKDGCGITFNFIENHDPPFNGYNLAHTLNFFIDYKIKTAINTNINIYYNCGLKNFKRAIAEQLYRAILLKKYKYLFDPFEQSNGSIKLNKRYKKLIEFYYNPEFPHNFKKSQLKKVIDGY